MIRQLIFFISLLFFFYSCTEEKTFEYVVDPVNVKKDGAEKVNRKSTTEFISIAYSDLFGTSIPQDKLINLSVAYQSFGDLRVIEERIISNFINSPGVVIPASVAVNGDTAQFIVSAYRKLYNREPNEFELHYWTEVTRIDTSANPSTIYFALMTSDEYRFY